MFTNTLIAVPFGILIALAFTLAISLSVVAADQRQDGVGRDYRGPGPVLINRCLREDWDGYGLRCDSAEEHHPSL